MFLCKFLACLLLLLALNCRTTIEQYLDKYCIKEICTARLTREGFPNYQKLEIYDKDVQAVNGLYSQMPLAARSGTCPTDDFLRNLNIRCNCIINNTICRVTYIDFSNKGLTGQIRDNIGGLTNLTVLDLSGNQLCKWIPQSFKNLTSLSILDLCNNKLDGPIPNFLGEMKSLKTLYLCRNQFNESIPPELGNLSSLEYLDLGMNSLSERIPNKLWEMPSLRLLDLHDNLLFGKLPEKLGGLSNLTEMYLMNNKLSGELPPSIGDLKSLQILYIRGNNFNGKIPNSIANLTNLQKLSLMGNNFEGPLPSLSSLRLDFIAITDLTGGRSGFPFPDFRNMTILRVLILRNCSLFGKIPPFIWELRYLSHLDLSFNNLTEGIPSKLNPTPGKNIFLRRNKLSGELPGWLMNLNKSFVDVSENNFARPALPRKISPDTNLFECCSNISSKEMKWLEADYVCADNNSRYDHLYINCGGNATTINQSYYHADVNKGGGSNFFLSGDKAWAYSSMGTFLSTKRQRFTVSKTCNISMVDAPLYKEARVAAVSLKYYGFCLKNGNYTLRLHFAEIGWDATEKFSIKKKRVFDVDIQGGQHYLRNFNIEEKAGGVDKDITKEFNITVNHNRMEIHLYWSGKGSTSVPTKYYGPLISAISLSPESIPRKEIRKLSPTNVGVIVGSSSLFVILTLALFWKLGWLGATKDESKPMEFELFPGEILTFEQIKAATKNFGPDNKIGEGGFGAVYEGELPNKMKVAVKKLAAKSKQGALEFMNEIVTTYAVKHPNLVRLLGCCAKKNDLLLVYEYMQNNSLEHVLFGKAEVKARLNWLTRVKICLDVAKGLAYLHEESKHKIIHRDIKPTNILLDEKFGAKISDFGYAQHNEEENKPLIKRIVGTKGYMAPEYMQGKLTAKADVYSFGIVILVIVSGKNITSLGPKQQTVYLWEQAYDYQKQGNLIALLDPSLRSKYTNDQVTKLLNLAMDCINPSENIRPSMSEVVKVLEGIVEFESAKWETETITTPSPSAVHDPIMEEPLLAYSQSTQLAGGTSSEGASDTTFSHPTSKEIDDSGNSA